MTDEPDVSSVLLDVSVLYEISLSVGRSLDLDENCGSFLRTLMARKSLDFASVWIRDRCRGDGDDSDILTQVYATPVFRSPRETLQDAHPLVERVAREPIFSVTHGEPGFAEVATEKDIDRGTFSVYRLGDLGFLKLYSIARNSPWPRVELAKLRHVVDIFTVSLVGCLDHMRVRSAEQKRRELELQMLHSQKLESLGVLAGGVAHDFNNLLTAILGNAELMKVTVPEHSPAHENVATIIDAAGRATDLCSQLLAYSGRGQFIAGPVCLRTAVEEILRLTSVAVSKKAHVLRELPPGLPAVDGDATQIQQIVMNLVTNASEALGTSRGELHVLTGTVDCGRAELDEFNLGPERETGEYIFLDVSDTGCGWSRKRCAGCSIHSSPRNSPAAAWASRRFSESCRAIAAPSACDPIREKAPRSACCSHRPRNPHRRFV